VATEPSTSFPPRASWTCCKTGDKSEVMRDYGMLVIWNFALVMRGSLDPTGGTFVAGGVAHRRLLSDFSASRWKMEKWKMVLFFNGACVSSIGSPCPADRETIGGLYVLRLVWTGAKYLWSLPTPACVTA